MRSTIPPPTPTNAVQELLDYTAPDVTAEMLQQVTGNLAAEMLQQVADADDVAHALAKAEHGGYATGWYAVRFPRPKISEEQLDVLREFGYIHAIDDFAGRIDVGVRWGADLLGLDLSAAEIAYVVRLVLP